MKSWIKIGFISFVFSVVFASFHTVQAQGSYIDLELVASSDYNKILGSFSYDNFENKFIVSSANNEHTYREDITEALFLFVNLMEAEKSYIVQHEPTYYFVLQYNKKKQNYLVMNNSIGEKNEALYVEDFEKAKAEMVKLLIVFYHKTPIFSISEFR